MARVWVRVFRGDVRSSGMVEREPLTLMGDVNGSEEFAAANRQELAPFFADKVPIPSATLLYGAAVGYLVKHGWRRMELGSGWWWREGFEEATVGDALDQQLEADGIDFRTALIGEPEEFCG